jgi:O-antigen ligase
MLLAFGVVVSGSRQAFLGLGIVTLMTLFLLGFFPTRRRVSKKGLVLAAVLIIGFGVASVWLAESMGVSFAGVERARLIFSEGKGASINDRADYVGLVTKSWEERPVFGYGAGSFGTIHGKKPEEYPHNIFLEILFDIGVAGLVLYCGFLLSVFRSFRPWGAVMRQPDKMAIMLGAGLVLLSGQVSGSYAAERALYGFLGLMCAGHRISE